MTAIVTEGMCVQEIAAPGTPPPQARMSRFGAAQAGMQGTGQSSATQHGDQPPTGPNDSMREANPYRSLGQPELFYSHMSFLDFNWQVYDCLRSLPRGCSALKVLTVMLCICQLL